MKIKTWIKWYESYLPPRCRKLRYDGGVYIIEGTDFEQIQSDISAAKQSLKDGNIDSTQKYLDKVSELS